MKENPYMFVNLIAKLGSKYDPKNKSYTQSNIGKPTYSGTEVICIVENFLGERKRINRERVKNENLDIPAKVANMR